MERELLTPEEVAQILKLSKYTVYEMVKRGELLATKVGRSVRIERADIEALINKSRIKIEHQVFETVNQVKKTAAEPESIIFMGSHDISLDYVVEHLNQANRAIQLVPAYVGSMEGLLSLYQGKADMAGCHLFDEETGLYNLPYIKRFFAGEKIYLIQFVKRNLGWIVAVGNPQKIMGWDDLSRENIRMINRQKGAGTRILLDYQLKRLGISSEQIIGYDKVERTHYGTASAVARGEVDFALGTESAASSVGMDFVQLTKESYDLVVRPDFLVDGRWTALQKAFNSPELREKISSLGGYDVNTMGEVEEVF